MLLKNIAEVRFVANVAANTEFNRLVTHIANAESSYIQPLLGSDTYAALIAYHDNTESYIIDSIEKLNMCVQSMSADSIGSADLGSGDNTSNHDRAWALLLYYTQQSIINLAYYKGFDTLNSNISDGGFHRLESERIKSLYKYQEDNLKNYFLENGFNGLDIILEFLELWSEYFDVYEYQLSKHHSRIIPDTKIFNEYYFINNSRLVFDRLRQHMQTIEDLTLTKLLGAENLAYILAEIKKTSPDIKVVEILPYLRAPIAWLSTAMLMEETGAELTPRGLYTKGIKSISNSDYVMNTAESRVVELIERNKKMGNEYLGRLKNYLLVNSSTWNQYSAPRGGLHNRDNTGKRTFFA